MLQYLRTERIVPPYRTRIPLVKAEGLQAGAARHDR
jgi:hypothetical protein